MLIILLTLICFILKLFAKFKFGFSFFVFTNVEHRFTRDLRFSFNSSSCFMFISFPFIHFFCSLFLFNGFFYLSFVFSVCLWVFTFTSFSSQCYTYKNIRVMFFTTKWNNRFENVLKSENMWNNIFHFVTGKIGRQCQHQYFSTF